MFWENLRDKIILKFFVYELKRRKKKSDKLPIKFKPPPVSNTEEEFRRLVENARDVVWKWDIKLGCTYVSPHVYEHVGWMPEEVLGKTPYDFVAEEDAVLLMQTVLKSIERGEGVKNFQCSLVHKNGRRITTEASTSPIFDSNGELTGFYGINRDVTERRRAKDLSDALNDINAAINSTLDISEVMHRVADRAMNAIDSDGCLITLRDEKVWVVKYRSGDLCTPIAELIESNDNRFLELLSYSEPINVNTEQNTEIAKLLVDKVGTCSLLSAPLTVRAKNVGAIILMCKDKIRLIESYEIDFFRKLSAAFSMALENSRLFLQQKYISEVLQESFMTMPQSIESIEFGHEYRSATRFAIVGGDFFDIFEMENNRLGIMIGDISGQGILAANLTALVKNSIKAYSVYENSPAIVLHRTNNVVLAARSVHMFATVFYGVLDRLTGELTYCCAGHPPAIIKRKTLDAINLSANSPSVGAFSTAKYSDSKVSMAPGDVLVLYTDGVIEARQDKDFFGEHRLIKFVRDLELCQTQKLPTLILKQVLDYSSGKVSDDIAILAISLKDLSESPGDSKTGGSFQKKA